MPYVEKNDDVQSNVHKRPAAGDEAAFKHFFIHHQPKLLTYILKIVKSKEIAEELVADIFVKIWFAREMLNDVENVDAFLHRMAVNKALDFMKMAARERNLRNLLQAHMQNEASTLDQPYEFKEYRQQIDQCMQLLTRQQQLVISLSREEGLTHDQIATRLQLSPHTVKNHIVTALKQLRTFIKHITLLLPFIF
jgi:RNA polymerase sigma-70 factor (ECF subfamily)